MCVGLLQKVSHSNWQIGLDLKKINSSGTTYEKCSRLLQDSYHNAQAYPITMCIQILTFWGFTFVVSLSVLSKIGGERADTDIVHRIYICIHFYSMIDLTYTYPLTYTNTQSWLYIIVLNELNGLVILVFRVCAVVGSTVACIFLRSVFEFDLIHCFVSSGLCLWVLIPDSSSKG